MLRSQFKDREKPGVAGDLHSFHFPNPSAHGNAFPSLCVHVRIASLPANGRVGRNRRFRKRRCPEDNDQKPCQTPIRKASEMCRTLPQTSEAFCTMRKLSEHFGTVPNAPINTRSPCAKSPGSLKRPAFPAPSEASSTGASRTGRALPGSTHFSIQTSGSISSPGKACISPSKRSRPKLRTTPRCRKRRHRIRSLRNLVRNFPKHIQALTKFRISGGK